MADISKIKLPNNTEYSIKDANALPKSGGTVTGNLQARQGITSWSCGSSGGTGGYFRFLRIVVAGTYTNRPIVISAVDRGQRETIATIRFKNANNVDPGMDYCAYRGHRPIYYIKSATSTWDFYIAKGEGYGQAIFNILNPGQIFSGGLTVTWVDETVTALPTGYSTAVVESWDLNASYASNAGTVNGLTVQTAVPANAKFTDTTYSVVSKTANGLAPQLPNETTTTKYLRQDGTWAVPAQPTVNNGTLTIQKNGTNVQTFTANQSSNATANITVPTKVSELTNDSGYTTNTGTVTQVKVGSTAYNPSSGVISLPAYPTDTNTHRPIQMNGTEILGNNTTALNLKAGSNITLSNSGGAVTISSSGSSSVFNNAVRFNPDTDDLQYYDGSTWQNLMHISGRHIDAFILFASSLTASVGSFTLYFIEVERESSNVVYLRYVDEKGFSLDTHTAYTLTTELQNTYGLKSVNYNARSAPYNTYIYASKKIRYKSLNISSTNDINQIEPAIFPVLYSSMPTLNTGAYDVVNSQSSNATNRICAFGFIEPE